MALIMVAPHGKLFVVKLLHTAAEKESVKTSKAPRSAQTLAEARKILKFYDTTNCAASKNNRVPQLCRKGEGAWYIMVRTHLHIYILVHFSYTNAEAVLCLLLGNGKKWFTIGIGSFLMSKCLFFSVKKTVLIA